jgi:formylglycine-generating enzyme required for sulfatase activity
VLLIFQISNKPGKPKDQGSVQPAGKQLARTLNVKVNSNDLLKYVWIPPGTFMMGCSPGDSACEDDEKPPHGVTLTKGFWMGQTLVTQAAYQRLMGKNPSYFKGASLPVERVTWDDSQAYCWMLGMRLATEAEWEYAARGGTQSSQYDVVGEIAWFAGNSGEKTQEVARKQPNRYGLYDMLGNVWQWVEDWYGPYEAGQKTDPSGPSMGSDRTLRGGSWDKFPRNVRVSDRGKDEPGNRNNDIGFRCVGDRAAAVDQ